MKEAEMFKEWESQEDEVGLSLSLSLSPLIYSCPSSLSITRIFVPLVSPGAGQASL